MDNIDRMLQLIGIAIGAISLIKGISISPTKLTIPKGLYNFILIVFVIYFLFLPRNQHLLNIVIIAGLVYLFAQGFVSKKGKDE